MKTALTLELICVDLPAPGPEYSRVGVQEGKVAVRQDIAFEHGQAVTFRLPLEAVFTASGEAPRWQGAYVQGTRQQPFVYLSWGARDGEAWRIARRTKFPLDAFPPEMVEQAARENRPLRARVRVTGSKGEPVTASLKPGQFEILNE